MMPSKKQSIADFQVGEHIKANWWEKRKHCPATIMGICPVKETVVVKHDDDSSEEKLKVSDANKTIVHQRKKENHQNQSKSVVPWTTQFLVSEMECQEPAIFFTGTNKV